MKNKLEKLLDQLEDKIPFCRELNQEVSPANVGWHIEHSLLTLDEIINFLIQSNPNDYKWKFNFIRIVVLTMKKIPRGKAKSPKVVQPKENIDNNDLLMHISKTRFGHVLAS